ncbi:hypothetical protein BS47DRAFT_1357207 [Hydnum rufescens UP504]|uniref:Uncharacterized protein n=1 Tax=Hydnum rufescens UP504 TaxID=1448309 RepID=A0A9P6BBJ6_9AGAM|nr:hypothetical protein BS47DRAFT_1357207 [Hydnum rufescens UP504]
MVDGIFTFYIAPISPFLETNVGVLGGCVLYAETDGDNTYHDEALYDSMAVSDTEMDDLESHMESHNQGIVQMDDVLDSLKISLVFLGSNETQWQFILMESNRRSQFEAYGPFPTTLPPTMHFLPHLQSQRWFSKLAYAHARTLKPN